MNVLLLNWRDPKNSKAGGAEKLNVEILRPFIANGDSVTWYAMHSKNLPQEERYKGIRIIRKGNVLTHFIFWPLLLWKREFGRVDFIIDSIHGIGYLSHFFAPSTRKIVLVCEVAQNIWDEMWSFPISSIGKYYEKVMYRLYLGEKFWTISESTRRDLITFGVKNKNIEILPMGFDGPKKVDKVEKTKYPSALFVGRLAEMKGVKDAIYAVYFANLTQRKKWQLHIVGRGEPAYESTLSDLVAELGIQKYVRFLGYVGEKEKFREMAKSWVLIVPSSREGWGMIVPEANYSGTAVIGYKSPGLNESLRKYSQANILVKSGSYKQIAKQLCSIKRPPHVREKIYPGWQSLHHFVNSLVARKS